jgi:hypothetical protein
LAVPLIHLSATPVRLRRVWSVPAFGAILLACLLIPAHPVAQTGRTYDLVYVKAPRGPKVPDVFRPARQEPNADLMLLHPDGTEDTLVDAPAIGAVTDPFVSFDGQWVFYSLFPDVTLNDNPATTRVGADIWKINIHTRETIQLTHGEYTPNAVGLPVLPYGVLNMGPTPLAGGRIAFVSNRNGLEPPKAFTPVTMQLFTMNADGSDVEAMAPMTLGSALHPFQLADGRIAFSTFESQGLRDSRLWGYWTIWEDGTNWGPLVSAFTETDVVLHFGSQLSDRQVVIEGYYLANNSGLGWLFKFPATSPTAPIGFGPPTPVPGIGPLQTVVSNRPVASQWPFLPVGASAVTPFTHVQDLPPPKDAAGVYAGKVTHPSGAPNDDLLLVWSPGPVKDGLTPTVDAGIYIAHNGFAQTPTELVLVKNDPAFNEFWPRAVVPYKAIYGVDEPTRLPVNKNDGSKHPALPAGTPSGIIGTASVLQRESFPGVKGAVSFDGLDAFYDGLGNSNWLWQGSDAGLYTNADIGAVRIITMEGQSARAPHTWKVPIANERMRILGEVPINADGSFAAKLPADTPFTFQLLDTGGRVLTTAQTWHQVRPGEMRVDCGGCHSHSKAPLDFATSAAASLPPIDLTLQPAHDVEFVKDIRPILQAKCASCHTATGPAPRLDSTEQVRATVAPDDGIYPRDYGVLAVNQGPSYGGPKALTRYVGANLSRWVRAGQSRRSLLMWTLAGRRIDGWTNARWPTETTPGDASTFPVGADKRLADLDFKVDHSALVTDAERRTVAAWIDLFAPLDTGGGFFVDETRPALSVTAKDGHILVGAADAYSGLDPASVSLTVNGQAVALTAQGGGIWSAAQPTGTLAVSARAKDKAGNLTARTVTLTSVVQPPATLPAPTNVRFVGANVLTSALPRPGFPIRLPAWLQWDAVPGAVAYCVDASWSNGTKFISQAPVMSLDFPFPVGVPGHRYTFAVRGSRVEPPAAGMCDGAVTSIVVER